jgi:hypothetical protein
MSLHWDKITRTPRERTATMKTLTAEGEITGTQMLKLELPCDLPPGPVEVVVVVQPRAASTTAQHNWDELYGLGREIWQEMDVKAYVRELREDREMPS